MTWLKRKLDFVKSLYDRSQVVPKIETMENKKLNLQKSARRIDWIVLHCSATKEGYSFDAKDIRRWHRQLGWSDIGYNYVIKLDGTIEEGRNVHKIPSHVKGYNTHSLGICYIGGLDANMKAKDTRTEAQKASMLQLLTELKKMYPNAKIQGHKDFPKVAKACPCFDAKREYSKV